MRGKAGRSGIRNRLLQCVVPVVVWLAAIYAVLQLLPYAQHRGPVLGIVDVERITLPAPVAGRLVQIAVTLHQKVEKGQLLARLDDEDVRLRLDASRQELMALKAEYEGRRQELKFAGLEREAREAFESAVETRRRTGAHEEAVLDQLTVLAELEEARIRLAGAKVEEARIASLEQEGIASDTLHVRLRTERDALARRVADQEGLLKSHLARTEQARLRLSELDKAPSPEMPEDAFLTPLRLRIQVQEIEMERIALLASRLSIVALAPGRVEAVHGSEGQWFAEGEPVLTITDQSARRIRAYVTEAQRDSYSATNVIKVERQRRRGVLRDAQILSISPAIVIVPSRLRRDPRIEEFAFEFVIQVEGDEAPGEMVSLRM